MIQPVVYPGSLYWASAHWGVPRCWAPGMLLVSETAVGLASHSLPDACPHMRPPGTPFLRAVALVAHHHCPLPLPVSGCSTDCSCSSSRRSFSSGDASFGRTRRLVRAESTGPAVRGSQGKEVGALGTQPPCANPRQKQGLGWRGEEAGGVPGGTRSPVSCRLCDLRCLRYLNSGRDKVQC